MGDEDSSVGSGCEAVSDACEREIAEGVASYESEAERESGDEAVGYACLG